MRIYYYPSPVILHFMANALTNGFVGAYPQVVPVEKSALFSDALGNPFYSHDLAGLLQSLVLYLRSSCLYQC